MKDNRDKEERRRDLVAWFAMLDDLAVIALVFLALWAFHVKLSVWSIVVIAVVLGAAVMLLHHFVVPALRRRAVTGAEAMVGRAAVVTDPLDPEGMVMFDGELWRARSVEDDLPAGTDVEIVAVDRLTLEVARK